MHEEEVPSNAIRCSDILTSCVPLLTQDCRVAGTYMRLSTVLASQLERQLPADAHTRCNGVTHVGITTVSAAPCHCSFNTQSEMSRS